MSSVPIKPRVLIADDSRIVRAALIKRIEGMFEFREAWDGEQAWEALLLDPSIRVLITDLTMPKLDGYGLLQRIRSSCIRRIRELPVVVVSGSDEQHERDRVRAAGADDLITKGTETPQLLSRLDVLTRLGNTQQEFERGLEVLAHHQGGEEIELTPLATLWTQGQALLVNAGKARKNFVLLNVCVGVHHQGVENLAMPAPARLLGAVGLLLKRSLRETDLVAETGEAEFTLISGTVNSTSARAFAQRICHAIARFRIPGEEPLSLLASCGVATLCDDGVNGAQVHLRELYDLAHRRALIGLNCGLSGVVGEAEELAMLHGTAQAAPDAGIAAGEGSKLDILTLLQWMREGRRADVLPHLDRLSTELKPLVDLIRQQGGD